jgi:hypothetical protein|tara:strand:- start:199 stop:486 length:288 start_codon:yes stop_codon:yes gene_type:complete
MSISNELYTLNPNMIIVDAYRKLINKTINNEEMNNYVEKVCSSKAISVDEKIYVLKYICKSVNMVVSRIVSCEEQSYNELGMIQMKEMMYRVNNE